MKDSLVSFYTGSTDNTTYLQMKPSLDQLDFSELHFDQLGLSFGPSSLLLDQQNFLHLDIDPSVC
jgi:hypothetical protein